VSILDILSLSLALMTFIYFFIRAINTRQFDKVKHAILAFDRASRKIRDRRRNPL